MLAPENLHPRLAPRDPKPSGWLPNSQVIADPKVPKLHAHSSTKPDTMSLSLQYDSRETRLPNYPRNKSCLWTQMPNPTQCPWYMIRSCRPRTHVCPCRSKILSQSFRTQLPGSIQLSHAPGLSLETQALG